MSCSSPLRNAQGRAGEGCCSRASQTTRRSNNQSHPLPTSPLAAPKGRGSSSLPCATRRGGLGRGLFAGKPGNAQKQQPKPPPPNLPLGCAKGEGPGSLPCATRRGGLGRGAVRGQARQRAEATAKATPSQPPPWLRQRKGARLPPLRNAQGRAGEGCCSRASQATRRSNSQSYPLPTSPLAAPKGRGWSSLACATRRGVCKGGFQRSAAGKRRQQLNLLPAAARWRRRRSPACRPSAPPGCGW